MGKKIDWEYLQSLSPFMRKFEMKRIAKEQEEEKLEKNKKKKVNYWEEPDV